MGGLVFGFSFKTNPKRHPSKKAKKAPNRCRSRDRKQMRRRHRGSLGPGVVASFQLSKSGHWSHSPKILPLSSAAQSRPFDLLVSPFWSSCSHGSKRLTFYSWVLWASEFRVRRGCFGKLSELRRSSRCATAPQRTGAGVGCDLKGEGLPRAAAFRAEAREFRGDVAVLCPSLGSELGLIGTIGPALCFGHC